MRWVIFFSFFRSSYHYIKHVDQPTKKLHHQTPCRGRAAGHFVRRTSRINSGQFFNHWTAFNWFHFDVRYDLLLRPLHVRIEILSYRPSSNDRFQMSIYMHCLRASFFPSFFSVRFQFFTQALLEQVSANLSNAEVICIETHKLMHLIFRICWVCAAHGCSFTLSHF